MESLRKIRYRQITQPILGQCLFDKTEYKAWRVVYRNPPTFRPIKDIYDSNAGYGICGDIEQFGKKLPSEVNED